MEFNNIRHLLLKAVDKSHVLRDLLAELNSFSGLASNLYQARKYAFCGVAEALLANRAPDDLMRLNHLAKCANYFDMAVAKQPDDAELRLLRFYAESILPENLLQANHFAEDKQYVLMEIDQLPDHPLATELYARLLTTVSNHKQLLPEEAGMINRAINKLKKTNSRTG